MPPPSALIQGTVQLHLDHVEMYGREKERKTLLNVLEQRVSSSSSSGGGVEDDADENDDDNNNKDSCQDPQQGGGLVLLGGQAGIGKSCLVSSLRVPTVDQYNGLFAVGKCEQQGGSSPRAAFTDAFDQICDAILSDNDAAASHHAAIGDSIRKVLLDKKEIANVLVPFLPKLRNFCSASMLGAATDVDSSDDSSHGDGRDYFQSSDQLVYALQTLIRAVSADRLLVMVIEDLQWADDSMLELIGSLTNDSPGNKKFVLIGTYRHKKGDIGSTCRSSKAWTKLVGEPLEHLQLDVLETNSIDRMISVSLDIPSSEETVRLARLLQERSDGVPFYVLQLLQELFDKELITYCFQTFRWKWNLSDVETHTKISNNLADIIVGRIATLPPYHQKFLKVASNLGSSFASEIVDHFLRDERILSPSDVSKTEPTTDASVVLARMGFIRRIGSTRLKFCHDRIQECANDVHLVGIEEETFHYRLGRFLLDSISLHGQGLLSNKESGRLYFVAVKQMNLGLAKMSSDREKLELARLNLKASKLARRRSAFVPAGRYALEGIECLRHLTVECWTDHYELCLKLYTHAAEMLACNGEETIARQIASDIIGNAISNEDKMPAYFCRVNMAGRSGDLERATKEGLQVLGILGERFPSREAGLFSIIREFVKTKKSLKGWSDEQILGLCETNRQQVVSAMHMMSIVSYYAAYASKRLQSFVPIMYLRMTRLTIEHGLTPYSGVALSGYGMVSCFAGNVSEGYQFGHLAVKLVDQCKSMRNTTARVNAIFHSFLSFRKEPLQGGLEPLLRSYDIGMESGDILSALTCAGAYGALYLSTGLPLGPLAKDYRNYLRVMETYDQSMLRLIHGIVAQTIFNLMGESESPLILDGEALSRDNFIKECDKLPHNDVAKWMHLHLTAYVAFIFEEHSRVLALLKEAKKYEGNIAISSVFSSFLTHYFRGSSGLEVWKHCKKRKYVRAAKRGLKALDGLTRSGCIGCYPVLLLLKAEILAAEKKSRADDVIAAFDHAISVVAKTGALQFRAIALEKAGAYLFAQDNASAAESYMIKAAEAYSFWGANAKVDALREKYEFLSGMNHQGNKAYGKSLRGRTRFDASSTHRHHRLSESLR